MIVYYNGRLVSADEPVISPLDHSFLYGHGLFETMRTYQGRVFRLGEHLARLQAAAALLAWPALPEMAELIAAIDGVLTSNQLADASIRLTLSRGSGRPRPDPASCGQPSVAIFASPLPPPLPPDGWSAATVSLKRNLSSPLVKIKSANYLDNILAKSEAKAQGAQEALMLNTAGFVAEGSMSNVFLVKQGRLITPDEDSGILPGITRRCVLELAGTLAIPAEVRPVRPVELAEAEEIFLTSSVMEVIPVSKLNGCPVGRQRVPGRLTASLQSAYSQLTAKE